jgi:hypothetical protein
MMKSSIEEDSNGEFVEIPGTPGVPSDRGPDGSNQPPSNSPPSNSPPSANLPDPSIGLPFEGEELKEVLQENVACTELFAKIDVTQFPAQEKVKIAGIKGNIQVANVEDLQISGIAKSIAGKNIGIAQISGIHESICLQANEISHISGIIHGTKADVALIGPAQGVGQVHHLSGINRSNLVLVNFEVGHISGIGKSLHIFGGRVGHISGIFDEIHLHNGAVVERLNGINQGIITH